MMEEGKLETWEALPSRWSWTWLPQISNEVINGVHVGGDNIKYAFRIEIAMVFLGLGSISTYWVEEGRIYI